MLDFAVKYRQVIDRMTMVPANGLRAYELLDQAWSVLRQLQYVLKVFKSGTLYFSRGDTLNLARVIPAMDHVEETLTDASQGDDYDNAIRVACNLAKKTLDKYYSLTDESATYQIAMILHPRHKLDYFKKLKWPQVWQRTARKLVETEYANRYAGRFDGTDCADEDQQSSSSNQDGNSAGKEDADEWAWVDEDPSGDERVRPSMSPDSESIN
ncbi:hypothetical protein LXA43DRAFT_895012 [Ganoderma leucocontextum]|nr:hypothetical protein LXA43DRAFT_895012 [Ganoderma leucocontextum]